MARLPDCQIDFHTRLARLGTLPDCTRLGEAPDCQIGLAARLPDWPSYQIARLAVLPDWQSICRHFCSSSGQIVSFWNQIVPHTAHLYRVYRALFKFVYRIPCITDRTHQLEPQPQATARAASAGGGGCRGRRAAAAAGHSQSHVQGNARSRPRPWTPSTDPSGHLWRLLIAPPGFFNCVSGG